MQAAPARAGDVLAGKYRVERVIGMGGMGIVVAATHLHLDQLVALKFMRGEVLGDKDAVERFLREARAAVRLKTHHVAKILDVGTLDTGSPYIVMEYLEGHDLAATLSSSGKLSTEKAADVVLQACHALAEAHSLGIIHRDLKPANLFMTDLPGGQTIVKVLDFGISKALSGNEASMTRTSSILGSPAYMSPEQMRSSKQVDARADIWSLGVILYELVNGLPPFRSEVFTDVCMQVMLDPPPPLAVPGLPPAFAAAVMRCLDKDPAGRFQTVAELADALAPFASAVGRQMARQVNDIARGKPVALLVSSQLSMPAMGSGPGIRPSELPPMPSSLPMATPATPRPSPVAMTIAAPMPQLPRNHSSERSPESSQPAFIAVSGVHERIRVTRPPPPLRKKDGKLGLILGLLVLLLGGAATGWYLATHHRPEAAPTPPAAAPTPPAKTGSAPAPAPTAPAAAAAAVPTPPTPVAPVKKPVVVKKRTRPDPDKSADDEEEPEQTAPSLVLPEQVEPSQ